MSNVTRVVAKEGNLSSYSLRRVFARLITRYCWDHYRYKAPVPRSRAGRAWHLPPPLPLSLSSRRRCRVSYITRRIFPRPRATSPVLSRRWWLERSLKPDEAKARHARGSAEERGGIRPGLLYSTRRHDGGRRRKRKYFNPRPSYESRFADCQNAARPDTALLELRRLINRCSFQAIYK